MRRDEKSLIIVNIPGVPSSRSSRGMEPYKLPTSRLQNPLMSSKLEIKSMNSCVFFRSAGTCVTMLFNDLTKNVDSRVAGVSVAA